MADQQSYIITMKITPPVEATMVEVLDWVAFEVGKVGGLSLGNPLAGYDLAGVGYLEVKET